MKNLTLFFVFIVLFISCNDGDISPVDVELTPFVVENYSRDARQLYYNELFKNKDHIDRNDAKLNVNGEQEVLKIIQAVYNSKSLERDTVFDIYKIHGYYCYNFNAIYLKVKPDLPAIKKLAEGNIPTGDEELDRILSKYGFESVEKSYGYPEFPWLTLSTKKEYNMIPIEAEFKRLNSVVNAEFNTMCVGDGDNIDLKRKGNTATITFSIGRGDCPAGCVYRRHWEFKVVNGIAQFERSY